MKHLSTPARPAKLSAFNRSRLLAGIALGNAAALVSRVTGRGSGASVKGQILTRVAPHAFADLVAGRRILAITGTNGKTTTSHLVVAALTKALGSDAHRLVANADGANLRYGIASALTSALKADLAVLETDERVVPDLLALGRPEVLVLLNFSHDQLDRNLEVVILARGIRDALASLGDNGPVVVANSKDPLVVWTAQAAREVVWVDPAISSDSNARCPECGTPIKYSAADQGVAGSWDCPGCDLGEPSASYTVNGSELALPDGTTVELKINLPGRFNLANAACGLAAVAQWGVPTAVALAGFAEVTSPAGRFATTTIEGVDVRLLLAKNPAGWTESLNLATGETLVFAIDAIDADGNDPSWLWDVDFEMLRGRHIIVTGPRSYDLAVRLAYAEVSHEVVLGLTDALTTSRALVGDQTVDVVTTYTPFQQLTEMAGLR